MRWLTAACVAILLSAGCVSKGDHRPPFDDIRLEAESAATPFLVQDHGTPAGHNDAADHRGSFNLERVGYHNGWDESGDPDRIPAGGYYTEIDIENDYAYLARNSASGTFGGFVILDIRARADPRFVGQYVGPGGADIEVSDDEQFAFFATQRNSIEQVARGTSENQDADAGAARGIHVVDIRDKTAPALASFFPLPYNGPHTVTYHRHVDGMEYLVACTYDFLGNTIPSSSTPGLPVPFQVLPVTQRVLVLRLTRTDDGATLAPVGQYQETAQAPTGKVYFPHDTYVEHQAEANRTLLYVSYWDRGLQILDLSDPAQPSRVSGFTEFGPSSLNAIHFSRPFGEAIAGRHVTVTEPEVVAAAETGQITFLDTTDPASPQKLGHWRLPNGTTGEGLFVTNLDFSPHNFDLWDGKVALAHYHGGLWVIDVSDEDNLRDPKTVAWTMDVPERRDPVRPQPWYWGVLEHDGYLYASDEGSGLNVYRYTGP